MLFSSFSTRSMVFAYFAKAQLPFSLFRDLFNDTAEFTLCYGLHDCSPLFQGYFIHSLSTLYYYNAPSLATRLTGDYRDRTYTGKCSPALLDTRKKRVPFQVLSKSSYSATHIILKKTYKSQAFLAFFILALHHFYAIIQKCDIFKIFSCQFYFIVIIVLCHLFIAMTDIQLNILVWNTLHFTKGNKCVTETMW